MPFTNAMSIELAFQLF